MRERLDCAMWDMADGWWLTRKGTLPVGVRVTGSRGQALLCHWGRSYELKSIGVGSQCLQVRTRTTYGLDPIMGPVSPREMTKSGGGAS